MDDSRKFLEKYSRCESLPYRKVLKNLRRRHSELWMIKVPADVDISECNGLCFDLDTSLMPVECEETGKQYDISVCQAHNEKSECVTALTQHKTEDELIAFPKPVSGYISIMDHVDMPDVEKPQVEESSVVFPDGLKERFVPFGAIQHFKKSKRRKSSKHKRKSKTTEKTEVGISEKSKRKLKNSFRKSAH